VQGILLVGVLDGKVINDQGKSNGSCLVAPEAGCDCAWHVPMGCQELLKLHVGEESGLREAIHAALNLNIDMAMVDQTVELVMVHDFVREHGHRDVHVGVVLGLHWCAQIKIFEVVHHALGVGSGDDTVKEDLDCG